MPGPVPADALRVLAAVLAPYLVPFVNGAASRPYSQTELPPGARRVKFLRTWRRARDAGDAGAWCEGRARLMTPESWAKWSRTERPAVAARVGSSLLEELGARRVGR